VIWIVVDVAEGREHWLFFGTQALVHRVHKSVRDLRLLYGII